MPKTFWQKVIFTGLTATCMVMIMSSYNMLWHSGGKSWFVGWENFWNELLVAMPLALFLAGKAAPFAAHKIFSPNASPAVIGGTITLFIALIMVFCMSLFVCVGKFGWNHLDGGMFLRSAGRNFLLAFPLQLLVLRQSMEVVFRNLIGLKFKIRRHLAILRPLLNNRFSVWSVKAVLITNVLVICFKIS